MKNFDKLARAYALKNAITHSGKAQIGAVISSLFIEGFKKDEVKEYLKKIQEIVNEVNSMELNEQRKEFEKIKETISVRVERVGLEELPNVKRTGIIMRFSPAPTGPLHVGHIISNMIQSLYVKKYGGKFYVRIEDTNPENTEKEAYENIKKDCDWIFGNVSEYIIQSERMDKYYNYAKKLIKKNSAYVCICSGDKFREFVNKKLECPCRNNSLKENMEKWEKMIDKKGYSEGEAILRFKTSAGEHGMSNPNPAMRDFPLARINEHEHPRQKHRYRVWPLMNLAVTVDDIELDMTHIIRGKDHMDNAKRQKMIYKSLGMEKQYPWISFIGRIKFTDVELSKRKIKSKIESGEYSGLDDKNLPTLVSLRKRGYNPKAFEMFAEERGLTEVDKVMKMKDFFDVIDRFDKELKKEKTP